MRAAKLINDALLARARQDLQARAAALQRIECVNVPPRDFDFADIRRGFGRGHLAGWLRQGLGNHLALPIIYRLTAGDQIQADALRHAFEHFVPAARSKLPRNNAIADSLTIYVGSSLDIRKRLREHLGSAANGTFALRMRNWCPAVDGSVRVEVSAVLGHATSSQVQDVEDALWRSSRPMFGRLGPK